MVTDTKFNALVERVRELEEKLAKLTGNHLVLNGAGFNMKLHDDKTSMDFDGDWLNKSEVTKLVEHLQKLLEQMV